MLTKSDFIILEVLMFFCVLFVILLVNLLNKKNKTQLHKIFIVIFTLFILWMLSMILQIVCISRFDTDPRYFLYLCNISISFLPVAFVYMALIFEKTTINFNIKHKLLLVIPTISNILLFTDNFHHLFYVQYSIIASENVYGKYFYVHSIYTYSLFAVSIFILMKYSIKNSGFFSRQAILIFLGVLAPIITNILGSAKIIPISIYATPISFSITVICYWLAILRFDLFKVSPIALQRIVDRISDSYLILNEDYNITDFNKTFLQTFSLKGETIRNENIFDLSDKVNNFIIEKNTLQTNLKKIENSTETVYFEQSVGTISKVFTVEVNNIYSNKNFLGILILFKDITQHKNDIQTIKNNQDMLIEQERLASLGQMIGGIAHNLKTPIFSVAGGLEGLSDLINEYDASIDNASVTNEDMHDIAKDMKEWIEKLRGHISYMSDVITAVKGQTVTLADNASVDFSVSELFKRVDILMKHEIKNALATLEIQNHVGDTDLLSGNINGLVQIINNIISNSIEAYGNNYTNKKIELSSHKENDKIVISIKDYGPGISEVAQKKLFKEMITTKGKNGTGLGMFMSYSNIKAHFSGDLTYETELGKGTCFYITLPVKN